MLSKTKVLPGKTVRGEVPQFEYKYYEVELRRRCELVVSVDTLSGDAWGAGWQPITRLTTDLKAEARRMEQTRYPAPPVVRGKRASPRLAEGCAAKRRRVVVQDDEDSEAGGGAASEDEDGGAQTGGESSGDDSVTADVLAAQLLDDDEEAAELEYGIDFRDWLASRRGARGSGD